MRTATPAAWITLRHRHPRTKRAAFFFRLAGSACPARRPTGNRHYRWLDALCRRAPEHPYSRLGAQKSLRWRNRRNALTPAARSYTATYSRRTSVSIRRFWHIAFNPGLASPEVPVWPLSAQRICVVGVSGLLDFQRTLRQRRCANARPQRGNRRNRPSELDVLRDNLTEFRVNIARLL